jgi:hypothetical protein
MAMYHQPAGVCQLRGLLGRMAAQLWLKACPPQREQASHRTGTTRGVPLFCPAVHFWCWGVGLAIDGCC